MIRMPHSINKVSGNKPRPSTWSKGASASTAKVHRPAAPGCGAALAALRRSAKRYALYTVAAHTTPGNRRSSHTGAPKLTSGHCSQPTSGGWSK